MAKLLITDELWQIIEPLLPKGGRPRLDNRAALTGILFVLKTGIPWEMLPPEMGCGSGMTCWRRLRDWQKAGVWEDLCIARCWNAYPKPTRSIGRELRSMQAVYLPPGGEKTGLNPTDRHKSGSKCHIVVDRRGVPLAVQHTAANVCDITMLLDVVDAIPSLPGADGQLRNRPEKLHGDRGYDSNKHRLALQERGIIDRLGRRWIDQGVHLGKHRWVVERTLSWLNRFRRLRVRYEHRGNIHQAFLSLGCALTCWKFVQRFC